jgi:hypothetical protein
MSVKFPEYEKAISLKPELSLEDLEVGSIKLDREPLTQLDTARVRSLRENAYIPAEMKREVHKRDRCCQFVSPITGKKCGSTYQTQVDHITPLAHGGLSTLENLRLL